MSYTIGHPHSLRRCTSCGEPFVADADTPLEQRCDTCEREDVPMLQPLWEQKWRRSLKMQRELREQARAPQDAA